MHRPELLGDDPERVAWMSQAACAEIGGDAWFPDKGDEIASVKRICRSCPVVNECLQYALDNKVVFGIWGGLSAQQRMHIRRKEVA